MNAEIEKFLLDRGADIVRFADISALSAAQTQGFAGAVLFAVALSRKFVLAMADDVPAESDEFAEKEHACDALADRLAEYIMQSGYRALSQSEASNGRNGRFDGATRSSALPHKTVALLAGLGYIGKNNLLVTEEYGCALSMCTVLTDAPVRAETRAPLPSKCGACDVCAGVCPTGAIRGRAWTPEGGRNAVVDVFKCTCALKCMVHCPWTLRYAKRTNA